MLRSMSDGGSPFKRKRQKHRAAGIQLGYSRRRLESHWTTVVKLSGPSDAVPRASASTIGSSGISVMVHSRWARWLSPLSLAVTTIEQMAADASAPLTVSESKWFLHVRLA